MLYSFEQGIQIQVFEFIKALLDNENNEKKVEFFDFFYKDVLCGFLTFLASDPETTIDSERAVQFNRALECARGLVVQILTKCVQEHSFRFRIFAL